MASSLARPPALRITWASPSLSPAYFAGSSRASMQVRIANCRAGGRASSPFLPKDAAYALLATRTSSWTLDIGRTPGFDGWLRWVDGQRHRGAASQDRSLRLTVARGGN